MENLKEREISSLDTRYRVLCERIALEINLLISDLKREQVRLGNKENARLILNSPDFILFINRITNLFSRDFTDKKLGCMTSEELGEIFESILLLYKEEIRSFFLKELKIINALKNEIVEDAQQVGSAKFSQVPSVGSEVKDLAKTEIGENKETVQLEIILPSGRQVVLTEQESVVWEYISHCYSSDAILWKIAKVFGATIPAVHSMIDRMRRKINTKDEEVLVCLHDSFRIKNYEEIKYGPLSLSHSQRMERLLAELKTI